MSNTMHAPRHLMGALVAPAINLRMQRLGGCQNELPAPSPMSALASQIRADSRVASNPFGTGDFTVHTRSTKAARGMYAISPATKHAHFATLIPIVGHGRLSTLRPSALVLRRCCRLWAWNILERPLGAKSALCMNSVSPAAQTPIMALGIPEVWHSRNRSELAHMGTWTMDVCVVATTAKAAMHVLAVCIAPMHSHAAARLPVVRNLWFGTEGARCCRWWLGSFWTGDPSEWEIAAKTALGVDPVRPTSEHTDLAFIVPVIRDVGVGWKLAAARGAWYAQKITTATESTL